MIAQTKRRANIYLSESDLKRWESIPEGRRSEFVSYALKHFKVGEEEFSALDETKS